jgi:Raf kinase inhibitor-like YbhB/YbcL family protein
MKKFLLLSSLILCSFIVQSTPVIGKKSPAVYWQSSKKGIKSYALILSGGKTSYWVVYDIPSDKKALPCNLGKHKEFSKNVVQGMNDLKHLGYDFPKEKKFTLKVYALDTKINVKGLNSFQLKKAIAGHVLEEGEVQFPSERLDVPKPPIKPKNVKA